MPRDKSAPLEILSFESEILRNFFWENTREIIIKIFSAQFCGCERYNNLILIHEMSSSITLPLIFNAEKLFLVDEKDRAHITKIGDETCSYCFTVRYVIDKNQY